MTVTSREVVERILRAGREADTESFVDLMAPDGYIEWPFRPPGAPARVQGRSEIRRFLTETAGGLVAFDEYRNVMVHETTDPEVIIVEYDVRGRVLASGAPFRQRVIAVFRVRDGQIVSYRDYLDPLPVAEALADAARAEG
ncbi:nuclear transport factor 2 family protein [Micromonospora sp. RP3T]|uniref:nuclear transport factor 2 family protein n=1 Tax=Micromonospora sp. RP3T TaxID=2135446 RepID=UPI000D177D8D|nr:nuclear transport factor 2 family protein [Micromonospora sp. RP3T]PTA47925.1 hypothetical protein C8054_02010 [Micromonospora sp. RP3T]